jgi:hypothetical protein
MLMFVDALAEDLSFDRAIDTYVRVMNIPEPLASTVATRALVVLGQELVPKRVKRAEDEDGSGPAVVDRVPVRLDEAASESHTDNGER